MKTIVFATQKGGAGKTTLCRSLAVEASQEGNGKIGLLDLDPQGTLTKWCQRRENKELKLVQGIKTADQIPQAIEALKEGGFRYLFIDTIGSRDEVKDHAIAVADFVVMPCQASQDDLDALALTISEVKEANKPFAFILSKTVRTRLNDMIGRVLGQHGKVCPTNFTSRIAHVEAAAQGKTAPEIGSKPAQDEITNIWAYVKEQMK